MSPGSFNMRISSVVLMLVHALGKFRAPSCEILSVRPSPGLLCLTFALRAYLNLTGTDVSLLAFSVDKSLKRDGTVTSCKLYNFEGGGFNDTSLFGS